MAFRKKVARAYKKGKKVYKFAKKHQSEAKQALVLAKRVARIVNSEHKYTYTVYNNNVSWTGDMVNLCIPTQGLTTNNRIGNSIKLMRLSGRIALYKNTSASQTLLRCIILRGKNENGTTPTVTSVLDNTLGGQIVLSPKWERNLYDTKIIYDKTYVLSADRTHMVLNWNFKMFGHINFQTGSVNTIEKRGGR